ncbi:MAG: hypothetical protein LBJ42_00600 [Holosporales bacterium]|nr:hypothetical protein [Holosporales bacterium]
MRLGNRVIFMRKRQSLSRLTVGIGTLVAAISQGAQGTRQSTIKGACDRSRRDVECSDSYKYFRDLNVGMPTLSQLNVMREIATPDSPPYKTVRGALENIDANWSKVAPVIMDIWAQMSDQKQEYSNEDSDEYVDKG